MNCHLSNNEGPKNFFTCIPNPCPTSLCVKSVSIYLRHTCYCVALEIVLFHIRLHVENV